MLFRARILVVILSVATLLFVINLVRTKKLKEEYALLWLLTAIVLVIASLAVDLLDVISYAVGVEYPPALMFLIAFLGVLFILFQFSISISKFSEQIKTLAQDLAILTKKVQQLEKRLSAEPESKEE